MALLQQLPDIEPVALAAAAPRIRRCTFRRLSRIPLTNGVMYDVSCLYPDRQLPLPIGDVETALPICSACSASHIFRPDED